MKTGPLVLAALVAAFSARRWRRASTEQRLIAVALVAGLGVYGVGLVHPPSLERVIRDAGTTLGHWTYLLVGVMAFLETGAFIGLVAPGEFTILLGGLVAGQGRISVVALMAIVWAAAVAGDCTSYALGRRLGRGFIVRHGPRFKITEERLEQVERFFHRHGGPAILIGRFVGLIRSVAPFVAGSSGMRFRRFLPFDVVGAGVWGIGLVLLGYVFWHSFDQLVEVAKRGAFALGAIIVAAVGAVAAYRHLRVPENRAAARAALDQQKQRPVIGPAIRLLLAAGQRIEVPARRLLGPPARFVRHRLAPGQLGLELTALLAVGLVSGFAFGGLAGRVEEMASIPTDGEANDVAHALRASVPIEVAKVLTQLGSPLVMGLIIAGTAAFLLYERQLLEGVTLLAASLLTYAALHIAKAAVGRARPAESLVDTGGSSFPSGHAAYAVGLVAVAVALRHGVPRLRQEAALVAIAVALTALVGLTRVYLGAHYLSDVTAGWGLAAAVFSLCGIAALVIAAVRQNARPG